MIPFLRQASNSLLMRIFLAVVVLAVALSLGISNFFIRNSAKLPVAYVGDNSIAAADFLTALEHKKHALKQYFGRPITDQEALGLGLVNRTVSELITRELMTQEAERIGIVASDEQVSKHMQEDPAFRDSTGKFNTQMFKDYLSKTHLSERKYLDDLRHQINRGMLAGSLDQQLRHVPKVFMEPMFRYLNEERDIEVVTVDFQAIPDLPQPSDSELEAFYTQHKQSFFAPETRSFNMLLLSFHEIAQAINVSNDDLLQLYKQSDNKVPEKRSVRFIPFRSREEAIKAKEELSSGAPFAVVYSRYTGDTPENAPQPQELELKQLRPEVGSEVFSMKRIHDVSDPIFLGNQYFLFVLTDIKPAKTLSFEEQKFALLKKYKTDIAREKMYDYTQRAEKMLASGAKLSDVSDSFNKEGIPGMVMVTWDKVTQDGKTIDGEPVTGIVAFDPKVLTTAFDTPQYTYSDPQKLATEDYVIIEVNDVKPAHQRSFAEALKQVQRYWQAEQKRIQAQHHIETIKQGIERFEDVGKLASANFGRVDVLNRVTRANTPKNPQFAGVLNQLNALKSEGIAMDVAANRIQIARVIGAYPVNMDAFKTSAPVFAHKVMIPLLSRDLLSSYIAALEAYFPVVRNEGYFKNFFGKEDLDNAPLPTAPDI